MYVWLWVAIISGIIGINAYESGIYVDNVFTRKTEMVNRLQWGSKRAIKQEILSLLGLQHLPKHVVAGKHNSAPSYMLDLYRTLQNDVMMEVEDEDQWMYRIKQEILNKNLTLPGMEDNAEEADMIMSFVNNGEFLLRHTLPGDSPLSPGRTDPGADPVQTDKSYFFRTHLSSDVNKQRRALRSQVFVLIITIFIFYR